MKILHHYKGFYKLFLLTFFKADTREDFLVGQREDSMVTTGDYELCSSEACTGYVNISNQQYQNIDMGSQSSSLGNHQLFWVHKHSLYRPGVPMGHGLFPKHRINGSILDSKIGKLQSIFSWAIWSQGQVHLMVQYCSQPVGRQTHLHKGEVRIYCNILSSPI